MKRDHQLVRHVLEYIETHGGEHFKGKILIDGYDRDTIVHHVKLLADGGFVKLGSETLSNAGPLLLTWKGCDYIDQIRARRSAASKPA